MLKLTMQHLTSILNHNFFNPPIQAYIFIYLFNDIILDLYIKFYSFLQKPNLEKQTIFDDYIYLKKMTLQTNSFILDKQSCYQKDIYISFYHIKVLLCHQSNKQLHIDLLKQKKKLLIYIGKITFNIIGASQSIEHVKHFIEL